MRLERDYPKEHQTHQHYFNSIKVRLERLLAAGINPTLANFNSIKVRLELLYIGRINGVPPFQFHKGAIRTYKTAV